MEDRILFVDDEPAVLDGYKRLLRGNFDIETTLSGDEALAEIEFRGPYPVVVSDMRMPGMNGAQFLAAVRQKWPEMVRMLLTGQTDISIAIEAINEGSVFRFLTKPCEKEVLTDALHAGVALYRKACADQEIIRSATADENYTVPAEPVTAPWRSEFVSPTCLAGPAQAIALVTPLLGKGPQNYVLVFRLPTLQSIRHLYGEGAATECLNIAANSLIQALRPFDSIFHWDHDTFLAVVNRCISSPAMRLEVSRRLTGRRSHILQVEGRSVTISLPITFGVLPANQFFALNELCCAFDANMIGTI